MATLSLTETRLRAPRTSQHLLSASNPLERSVKSTIDPLGEGEVSAGRTSTFNEGWQQYLHSVRNRIE